MKYRINIEVLLEWCYT